MNIAIGVLLKPRRRLNKKKLYHLFSLKKGSLCIQVRDFRRSTSVSFTSMEMEHANDTFRNVLSCQSTFSQQN